MPIIIFMTLLCFCCSAFASGDPVVVLYFGFAVFSMLIGFKLVLSKSKDKKSRHKALACMVAGAMLLVAVMNLPISYAEWHNWFNAAIFIIPICTIFISLIIAKNSQ